jgi:hypothetical protein
MANFSKDSRLFPVMFFFASFFISFLNNVPFPFLEGFNFKIHKFSCYSFLMAASGTSFLLQNSGWLIKLLSWESKDTLILSRKSF